METEPFDGQRAVAQAHDLAVSDSALICRHPGSEARSTASE